MPASRNTLFATSPGEADALRRRLEDHFHGSAAPRHLERKRVGSAAATLPRATAPLNLNHVEFRIIDRPPDRWTDLAAAGTAEAPGPEPAPSNTPEQHTPH